MGFWVLAALFVATTVLGELLRPRPKFNKPKASSIDDFSIPTADNGRPIPVPYGTVDITGPNVLWYGNLRIAPISDRVTTGWFGLEKKTITYGYKYGMDMVLGVCWGKAELLTWRKDGKSVNGEQDVGDIWQISGVVDGADYQVRSFGEDGDEYSAGFGGTASGFNSSFFFSKGSGNNVFPAITKTDIGIADHPGWNNLAYVCFHNFNFGGSAVLPSLSFTVRRLPNPFGQAESVYALNIKGAGFSGWTADANPALVIYDILTDINYGLSIPTNLIDQTSFQNAALKISQEVNALNKGVGVSFILQQDQSASEIISDILRYCDGVIYTSLLDGKIYIKLARDDYNVNDLISLNEDNIVQCEITRGSWLETSNTVKVEYNKIDWFWGTFSNAVAQVQDLANVQVRNEVVVDTVDFMACTDPTGANMLAQRALKTLSFPLSKISIQANRNAWSLNPGDVFKLTWSPLGVSNMVCRVVNINYGNITDGKITIDATEDIYGTTTTTYTDPQDSGWVDPITDVQAVSVQKIIEAPLELVEPGQLLEDGGAWSGGVGEQRFLMVLAGRSGSMDLGYDVYTDPAGGTTYGLTNTATLFTPYGSLSGAYNRNGVNMTLDTSGFYITPGKDVQLVQSLLSGQERTSYNNLALIDDEIISFRTIALQGDGRYLLTNVLRGVLDTVPADHSNGAIIYFFGYGFSLTNESGYPRIYSGGSEVFNTVNAKLLPYNTREKLAIGDAAAMAKVLSLRSWLPYPPAIRVNSIFYPATTYGDSAIILFKKRDRILQNNQQQLVAHGDDHIAETTARHYENTYYGLKIYVGGVLKHTINMTALADYTYTIAQRITDDADLSKTVKMRMWSENANGKSADNDLDFVMTGLGMPLGLYLGGSQG